MKDKTAKQLADAITEMLEANQLSAAEMVGAILEAPIPTKAKNLVRIGFKAFYKYKFKSLPEPRKNQLDEALAMMAGLKSTPHKFRALLKQRIKELPHEPGGAPRKVKLEEELTVCAEIERLRAECDTREAIRRVARKRGASERTIYRVWGKYNPKKRKILTSSKP